MMSLGNNTILANVSVPLSSCRFCLRPASSMRSLPIAELPNSDIPQLFEIVTAIKLDMSPGYSELLCDECEQGMRNAAQTRVKFLHVVQQWQWLLDGMQSIVAKDFAEAATTETNSESRSGGCAVDNNNHTKKGEEEHEKNDNVIANNSGVIDEKELNNDYCKNSRFLSVDFGRPQCGQLLICDICKAQLKNKALLLRHMRAVHQSTCHICGKTNLKRLDEHLRHHRKEDRYKCAYCPRTFSRLPQKCQHERQHTGERPFICEVCAYTFTSSTALKKHARQKHSDVEVTETTKAANDHDHDKPDLLAGRQRAQVQRKHIEPPDAVHKKLPPHVGIRLECPLCHNTYVNRKSMQPHMKFLHGAEGVTAWKRMLETICLLCGDRFAGPNELNEHRQHVHQTHQCDICQRRFQSRITLELHVQKHSTKERRHECLQCGKRYTCAYTLRMHLRRAHTDERPYQCEHCAFAFAEQWHLNSHMKMQHTFEKTMKPHKCVECAQTFRTVGLLRSHMEQHTGQFRYQCKVCKRNLHAGPLLEQHMRSYHVNEWRAEEEKAVQRRMRHPEAARATIQSGAVEEVSAE